MNQAALYDEIYSQHGNYAKPHKAKIDYVTQWVKRHGNKVLDAGCGRGEYARSMMKAGKDVTGVEISKTCCDKYLKDINHVCTDILTHNVSGKWYDCVYCTDVLEHIEPDDLDTLLSSFKLVSNKFLFLVCTGSDVKSGHELHVSNMSYGKWEKKLTEHFVIEKSIKGFDEWSYIHIFECEAK